MKKAIFILSISLLMVGCSKEKIYISDLHDKIAGAWVGQMVGNMYGLPHENKYIDNPGDQSKWPYGYSKSLDKLELYKGAFSDDDTDVEYLYLLMMEKYGYEPTYHQLREGWMHHMRDRVWLANRGALGLMHHGFAPPYTGSKLSNPHWYQIDPQLINEIWGYTAPGMPTYAAEKSAWAARITSDDWAIAPTIHYGAMYSMAFFESNMEELIIKALDFLPEGDRYKNTVKEAISLYHQYPDDWQKARKVIAQKYYVEEDEMTKTIWNANLNGACGILSMLYGKGDLQLTMDLGCAMGFDADNQTATVGGILGVIYGAKSFPDQLTKPIKGWTKPFNDRYINITRFDMPDASIEDIINRTVEMAIKVVCAKGGELKGEGENQYLLINKNARFDAPLEYSEGPMPRLEVGIPVDTPFGVLPYEGKYLSVASGKLPDGLTFEKGHLRGTPSKAGMYRVELMIFDEKERSGFRNDMFVEFIVRTPNIAPDADTIYASVREVNEEVLYNCWITFGKPMYAKTVEVINDGIVSGPGSVFYSLSEMSKAPKKDWFGYGWDTEKNINMVAFHAGCMEEFGGWYEAGTLKIQYLDEKGKWKDIPHFTSTPSLPETDIVFFQPHFAEYIFEFEPVKTKGIRIIGDDKVQDHWNKYTKNVSCFISITELSVYEASSQITLSKSELADKIKGGWAGQTIGVVYGAPTEFKFTGTTIQDYQPIPWGEHYIKYWWDKKPGLFDDIYNDLTFVETFEQEGLDCSTETLAKRFAFAEYHLAHANQASRYNIRNGIMPPLSGFWMNNPHADDLDFQIEADFIGLMTPGLMPQAMDIASRVGHIMNSGDGFYGGAFVAGLYAAAFVSNSPAEILDRALQPIPHESQFYQCLNDVRKFHKEYPDDWQSCWFEMHKKWNKDVGCPKGVFLSFNIDAKINSAYVAIGLLYGGGDFSKSIEIATRCGQDSDCNPATVGGVLGVMNGYSAIPSQWLNPLKEIEPLCFAGTDVSLAKAYDYSLRHSLEMIQKNGGSVSATSVTIPQEKAEILPLEENFKGMYPYFRDRKDCFMKEQYDFDFTGNGFIIWGNICCLRSVTADYINRVSTRHIGSEVFGLAEPDDSYIADLEVWIDGKLDQKVKLPMKNTDRRLEPAWKYMMKEGKHKVSLKWLNPDDEYTIRINDIVYYSSKPVVK